ncbi:MAG: SPOR domain-containing protein [Gammaproteobacteria bacterium]|nr:SPOR domain-containing protein [Gammaproteobacteria bacterium]
MKVIILFLILFLAGFNTQADADNGSYSIQLGAYKNPDMNIFSAAEEYGALYTEESVYGLTLIKLGHYASRSEAVAVLRTIRDAGFRDAFLTSAGAGISSFDEDIPMAEIFPVTSSFSNEKNINPESLKIWNQLSDLQRESVIYLDGILHIDEDGQFIPLSDYARKVMQ